MSNTLKKPILLEEPPSPTNGNHAAKRPANEAITFRAHEIFLKRGAAPGFELEDWLQAERELVAEEIVKTQPGLAVKQRANPAPARSASRDFQSRSCRANSRHGAEPIATTKTAVVRGDSDRPQESNDLIVRARSLFWWRDSRNGISQRLG